MSSTWQIHDEIAKENRRLVAAAMDALWRDALCRMPHLEDDPYVTAIFSSARDSHARLFDLLRGLTDMLQRVEERETQVLSASSRPDAAPPR